MEETEFWRRIGQKTERQMRMTRFWRRIGQDTRKMMGRGFWREIRQAKEEKIGQETEER